MTGILQPTFNPRRALIAGFASIGVVAVLIVIKTIAYLDGGSTGVLAALVDSITDAAASIMSLVAIHISIKPADHHHRHGHGKIEGLAALGQAAFIAGAAVFLSVESIGRLLHPVPLQGAGIGIVVLMISTILSVLLVLVQRASLRHAPSLAVESDKAHYGADIVVNIAVMAVLFMQAHGLPAWADPLVAGLVALWLLRTAWIVAGGGVDMLLDREVPDDERARILQCVLNNKNVRGIHDMRTRRVGMSLNISFDIEVDADLNLRDAHAIARDVEASLLIDFPNAEIMIHVDPEGETEDGRHSVAGLHN